MINSNMRCIEMETFYIAMMEEINSNMRCIEILDSAVNDLQLWINSNMRCIEIAFIQ